MSGVCNEIGAATALVLGSTARDADDAYTEVNKDEIPRGHRRRVPGVVQQRVTSTLQ